MNPFVQQMVNHKINRINAKQLHDLANQYDTPISMKKAEQITAILHEEPIDIIDEKQRNRILRKIAREVDPRVAEKIRALLHVFMS